MLNRIRQLLGRAPDGAGARAERLAADWLRRHAGFRILAANWRNPRDHREEIDLVGEDGNVLVFVEVKARSAGALVRGYYAVDRRKKDALTRAFKAYLARLNPKPLTFRFDIVEVALPKRADDEPTVRHFQNIPLFSKYYRG